MTDREEPKMDIVERLFNSDAASALTNEAAREIEALRAQVEVTLSANRGLVRLNEATEARAERAEAALAEAQTALSEAHQRAAIINKWS